MKKTLITLIVSMGLFLNAQAQREPRAGFQIGFPDQSSKSFFTLYPEIDCIIIKYKNNQPVNLDFRFKQSPGKYSHELFDMAFEGDKYFVTKKYETLVLPNPGKLTMDFLAGVEKLSQRNPNYDASVTLRPDSIFHHFSFFTSTGGNLTPSEQTLNRAKLKGGIAPLQKKLEQNFKQWKPIKGVDSAILISGVVSENGTLGKLETKIGEPSQFSNRVLEFIQSEAIGWQPAWQNRNVRYQIKFFVRLNPDGSITLSML